MAEQNESLEGKEWKRDNRGGYYLPLGNSGLTVVLYKKNVHVVFERPGVLSEEVTYNRESGELTTYTDTYQHTPVGRILTKQEGREPINILANKDKFLNGEGFAPEDKKLVDLVLGFIQEEF